MSNEIYVLKTKNEVLTEAEIRLQELFSNLLEYVEKTSQNNEDSILLAGAMMGVAQMLLYEKLVPVEADKLMDHNTADFVALLKPTIHQEIKMANTGRMNLLEEVGRIDAEKPNKNRRAEKKRVIGELNKGYKGGGMAQRGLGKAFMKGGKV